MQGESGEFDGELGRRLQAAGVSGSGRLAAAAAAVLHPAHSVTCLDGQPELWGCRLLQDQYAVLTIRPSVSSTLWAGVPAAAVGLLLLLHLPCASPRLAEYITALLSARQEPHPVTATGTGKQGLPGLGHCTLASIRQAQDTHQASASPGALIATGAHLTASPCLMLCSCRSGYPPWVLLGCRRGSRSQWAPSSAIGRPGLACLPPALLPRETWGMPALACASQVNRSAGWRRLPLTAFLVLLPLPFCLQVRLSSTAFLDLL